MCSQTFSQRYGYKEVRESLQKESIDSELKTALWNFIYEFVIGKDNSINKFLWKDFFHLSIDQMPSSYSYYSTFVPKIKSIYFNNLQWFEIYDLLEFIAKKGNTYEQRINNILKKYCSAYTLINNEIVEITSEHEIQEIEIAINSPLVEINIQLKQALSHLSARDKPDYRNSIKESISAVECLCRKITGKNTLGKALGKLESEGVDIDRFLKEGMDKIYTFTNGEDGIRHAMMDKPNLAMEDARFMLVMCSSFINYIIEKANKAGISFNNK